MIYIHVPFCRSFCTYCDFYSEIPGGGMFESYTDQVCAEIRRRAAEMDDELKTLYFGGGTPSVLPLSYLTRILLTLEECGHGGPYTEFTLEANPEDIVEKGLPYVESLRQLGVNRMSMGIQSFDDDLLRWMNRRHSAEGAREAFRLVRQAGFENVSIDLIFGLSNLSDEVWENTIDQAIALGPEHISCYQLTVEGDNVLAMRLENGEYEEASDETCRHQYDILCRKMAAAGFHHYEISNFAKPGFEAVHNGGYWARRPYVGLGRPTLSADAAAVGTVPPWKAIRKPVRPLAWKTRRWKPSCWPSERPRASTESSSWPTAGKRMSNGLSAKEPCAGRAGVTASRKTISLFPTKS